MAENQDPPIVNSVPVNCAEIDDPRYKWRINVPTSCETWHLEAHEKGELAKILNLFLDQPGRIIITTLW